MALINCPECNHEISDTAKSCPNCGYTIRKVINKKTISICCSAAVIVLLVMFIILKCTSFSVVGEWKIDYYISEGGNIQQEHIGEYYGENYQTGNSAFSVEFKRNGTATLHLPTYEGTETTTGECKYEIRDNYIYFHSDEGLKRRFEIKDNKLILIDSIHMLLYSGDDIINNIVMKKK